MPLVWAASSNVVRSANVIRAGVPLVPPGLTVTSWVLLSITSDARKPGAGGGFAPVGLYPLMSYVPV